jgi:hypothetical protein
VVATGRGGGLPSRHVAGSFSHQVVQLGCSLRQPCSLNEACTLLHTLDMRSAAFVADCCYLCCVVLPGDGHGVFPAAGGGAHG